MLEFCTGLWLRTLNVAAWLLFKSFVLMMETARFSEVLENHFTTA
jgi:hypothetical protein